MVNKKILAIQAHPDDESFGMGGTLALYAQQGVEITLVTATGGENGPVPEAYKNSGQSVKDIRTKELDCAIKALGITRLIRLGYQDSGMEGWDANKDPLAFINQSKQEVSDRILQILREFQPQVVLTHNAKGDYGHPDHRWVYETSLAAFENYLADLPSTGTPNNGPVLYSHLMPKGMLKSAIFYYRLVGKDPRHFGENGDVDLVALSEHVFSVDAQINYASVRKIKQQASACHASQGGGALSTGFEAFIQKLIDQPRDQFTQVLPEVLSTQHVKTDLFEGLAL
ncbi:MAG TPA: PIG-L family deacetylase [Anaerolineaceae bacterium]|nr:PIG-L family deacetylase [Anaerolineaceae bacterium]